LPRSASKLPRSFSSESQPRTVKPCIHSCRVKTHIVAAFICHAITSMIMSVGSTCSSLQNFSIPSICMESLSRAIYMRSDAASQGSGWWQGCGARLTRRL